MSSLVTVRSPTRYAQQSKPGFKPPAPRSEPATVMPRLATGCDKRPSCSAGIFLIATPKILRFPSPGPVGYGPNTVVEVPEYSTVKPRALIVTPTCVCFSAVPSTTIGLEDVQA